MLPIPQRFTGDRGFRKMIFKNSHLWTLLFRLDKAIKGNKAVMAKGYLSSTSKASQHIAQLSGWLFANAVFLHHDHYLAGLRMLNVIKICSVRYTRFFMNLNLVLDKEWVWNSFSSFNFRDSLDIKVMNAGVWKRWHTFDRFYFWNMVVGSDGTNSN